MGFPERWRSSAHGLKSVLDYVRHVSRPYSAELSKLLSPGSLRIVGCRDGPSGRLRAVTTTALGGSAPLAHRFAHAYSAAGLRGRAAVWRLAHRLGGPRRGGELRVGSGSLGLNLDRGLDGVLYAGMFETGELALIGSIIRPGDVCVDVGANIGLYSVLCASRGARVIAFEPTVTHAELTLNLAPWPDSVAINIGISDEDGELHMGRPYAGEVGDAHSSFRAGTCSDPTMPVRRLAGVPQVAELETIDFLKVDVEGWEPQVIAGARELWERRAIGIALVEVSQQWGATDYLTYLADLGYACFSVETHTGRLRRRAVLTPVDLDRMPGQINVLVVRPDRMNRLPQP